MGLVSAACGHPAPAGARFCPECGAPLLPEQPEGERRQLTALFCDLVGSTELSARLDPEEYADRLQRYQRTASRVVKGYGGEVTQVVGDGILVSFGWPEAHDDDAERALRAGLELVQEIAALGRDLAVRVGVHTGLVVIEEAAGEERPESIGLGRTLEVATRVQQAASPGMVAVSDDALRLVRGIFVTEPLEDGAHQVVQATGVRSRIDAAPELTPLVGREPELELLLASWRGAARREGAAVLVTGEAGVGKSRLVYELRERLAEERHSWLETACAGYTRNSAFRPVIELLEDGLGFQPEDGAGARTAKLERALERDGLASPEAVALMAELLSLPAPDSQVAAMSPELRRRRTIELLAAWLMALAEPQPLVLLVEDLHWCDPSSLELFERLAGRAGEAPLLVLATARPELERHWEGRAGLTVLRVAPLRAPELRRVLGALGGGRPLPDEVVERVADEADGIPLYAEEIARTLLESDLLRERGDRLELVAPLDELGVPMTLQGSLMARLDRLNEAKRVAQRASVIGREFRYRLLEEVAGLHPETLRRGLDRLVEGELIFQHGCPPEATYTFKHALIQEAACESLLLRTRRALNARIADALERSFPGDAAAAPERVARHFEAAGRAEAAVDRYRAAAAQAAERSAPREASEHLRRAIALLPELEPGPERDALEVDLQAALGSQVMAIHSYAHPDVEAAYERARELCEALGDGARTAEAMVGLSIFYSNHGQVARGAELAERVLEVARREGDDRLELLARVQLALPRYHQGRFAEALDHCRRAAELHDRERDREIALRFGTDHGVAARAFGAWSLWQLGRPDEALAWLERATALARSLGRPFDVAFSLFFETVLHWFRGDADAERAAAERLAAVAEEQDFEFWLGLGRLFVAATRARATGDPATLEDLLEGAALAVRSGSRVGGSAMLAVVAEAQRAVGALEEAAGSVSGALALAEETGQPFYDAELHRLQGELSLDAGGDPAEAQRSFERALAVARAQGARSQELRVEASLERLRTRGRSSAPR
jgi:class 3 adenylate cyclase/tetratricopeptide (TPR) repeat protein